MGSAPEANKKENDTHHHLLFWFLREYSNSKCLAVMFFVSKWRRLFKSIKEERGQQIGEWIWLSTALNFMSFLFVGNSLVGNHQLDTSTAAWNFDAWHKNIDLLHTSQLSSETISITKITSHMAHKHSVLRWYSFILGLRNLVMTVGSVKSGKLEKNWIPSYALLITLVLRGWRVTSSNCEHSTCG